MPGGFTRVSSLALAVLLSIVACTLRFSDLGTWSFANDETATLEEDDVLFREKQVDANSQTGRLPRMTPVAYGILHVGYQVFGRDEFGSRVVPALFGSFSVLVVFLILHRAYGTTTAFATGLLVAGWPEHVLRSQQNRFYIVAMFLGSACLLLGSLVAERRSFHLAFLTSVLGVLATLSHGLTIAAQFLAVAGLGAVAAVCRVRLPAKIVLVYAGGIFALVALVVFHIMPLARGWNAFRSGYSLIHALLAAVNSLGWPISVFSVIGVVYMTSRRTVQDVYWITVAAGWGCSVLMLPVVVVYHPGYVFPLALAALIPAGVTVGVLHDALSAHSRTAGAVALVMCCVLNLPSLVSHYRDGSRPNWRAAADFVRQRWQPGDRVTSFAVGFIGYYAPQCEPRIPLSVDDTIPTLERLSGDPGRLWFVAESSRGGLDAPLKTWLRRHCTYAREVVEPRYDYNENRVDVYHCP